MSACVRIGQNWGVYNTWTRFRDDRTRASGKIGGDLVGIMTHDADCHDDCQGPWNDSYTCRGCRQVPRLAAVAGGEGSGAGLPEYCSGHLLRVAVCLLLVARADGPHDGVGCPPSG